VVVVVVVVEAINQSQFI